jgi:hypothetical protein
MSLKIPISFEQRAYAKDLTKKIVKKTEENNLNYSGWGKATKETTFTGFLGEVVFADYFKLSRPIFFSEFDKGYDFLINGRKFDVKTRDFHGPGLDLILYKSDVLKDIDGYILQELESDFIILHGFLPKKDFLEKAKENDFGYGPRYAVNKKHFRPISELILDSKQQRVVWEARK